MVDKVGETIYDRGLQVATILGQGRGQGSTFRTLSCKKRSEVSRTCKYYALIRVLLQAYVDFLVIIM